ncbi:acyltransferase family protein [Sphingobium sufflavum]|uniref:acyltransferase family protein n=1 Tax=Sphingobium sufflavum TaxID=1129547 RepID=UPI001F387D77|nr:acyltransferase family protein [Sphingobium sufflavum]
MAGKAAAQKRVEWVDAAKGVGILLVIAGHVWWRPGSVHQAIYAFHMPLFFLLSGYMVKPQPTAGLIGRQARSLLVPFAAFSLILIAVDLTVEGLRGTRPIFPGFGAGVEAILWHTESLRGPFTILWFIPCLFFARIGWNMVARCWPDARDGRWAVLVALVMAGAHGVAARTSASPLGLMAVPAAFTLYWVGQYWKARPPGMALTLLVLLPLAAVTLALLPPVNLKPGDFGMPVLSLAGAVAISILLCQLLARMPHALVGPLAWLGRASLVIMYMHVAFIHYLTPYCGPWALFALALAGSLLVHVAAGATRAGRIVLLGDR